MFSMGIDQNRIRSVLFVSLILASAFFITPLARAGVARAEPASGESRFGDSTWIAPNVYPDGDPSESGPRVNDPDREATWETVVRTPFRVVFFPLRLLGDGLGQVAGVGEKYAKKHQLNDPSRARGAGVRVSPRVSLSNAQGLGGGATVRSPLGSGSAFRGDAIMTLKDNRFLRARALFGEGHSAIGFGGEGLYDYRPNRRFYGVGNDASDERTIFLERENRGEGWLFFGRDSTARLRAIVGISDVHVGNGYNDIVPHAGDVYSPNEVPSLGVDSRVWSYGLGAQYAAVDRLHEPSRGFHFLGEARRAMSADSRDLRYRWWRAEGRTYLPIGASRRVLALRGVFTGADPENGSEPIPFYRLPVSTAWDRFLSYSGDRFRDQRLVIAQAEYRWLIWSSSLWAVAIAQRGVVAPTTSAIRYSDMRESYGGGLRFKFSDTRTTRLDITKGTQGLNINLDLDAEF